MENIPKRDALNEQLNKPEWLRKLEEESWQAELIISGLAILGALQSPYYIGQMIDWSICYFQPKDYFFIFMFFIYLTCASTFLIICFISHFILRAVWIGMLGLNYVFPKGIDYDSKQYSPTFLKKMEKKFPNDHQDIIKLEKACSAMFGIATTVMIVLITLNINILIIFGIKNLLEGFVSSQILSIIGNSLLVLVFGVSILMYVLNLKRFHADEKVQNWYFKIGVFFSKMMYHIFYYPITRITYLFVTNSSIKGFGIASFGIFMMVGIISTLQFKNSNILHLARESRLHDQYARTDMLLNNVYEENLKPNDKIFSAVIPSEKITGGLLKVFVPIFSNESNVLDSLCGEWQKNETLSNDENRSNRQKHNLTCYQKYHQFYVNDSLYTSELLLHKHTNQHEAGVLTYLSTKNFKKGKNILRVEKIKSITEIHRTMNVTFWFSNN